MSNKTYQNGYYNEAQKQRYLDTLSPKSTKPHERVLNRAYLFESELGMDLYDFNLPQLESLLYFLEPGTLASSRANYYIILHYIRWAIEHDLRQHNDNPLEGIADIEYYKKFMNRSVKTLYTKGEIDIMVDRCVNAQDSVVVQLIFEGVFGSNGYDELLNLKRDSLLANNTLLLRDGDNERTIRVTDKCWRLVNEALNSQIYYKKNGEAKSTLKSPIEASLVKSDYVLRNVDTHSQHDFKADKHLVQRRITAFKRVNHDGFSALTPYVIRNSGMLYKAYQLYTTYGTLDKSSYEIVCKQFGLRPVRSHGYEMYHYHRLRDDFLNVETIRTLYKDSIG